MNKQITLDKQTVEALLAANVRNRRRAKFRERTFAEQMRNGTWNWDSPQATTFIINESGDWLLDGQTRLYAIQSSGCYGHEGTLQVVPDDRAEDIFKTLDTGRVRLAGATLTVLGYRNGNNIAGIARVLLHNACGSITPGIPTSEVNEFVAQKFDILDALPIRKTHAVTRHTFHVGILAGGLNAVRLGIATLDEVVAFLESALRDEGDETSPTKMLSRYFTLVVTGKRSGGAVADEEFAAATRFIAAHKAHRKVRGLKISDNDLVFARSGEKTAWEI